MQKMLGGRRYYLYDTASSHRAANKIVRMLHKAGLLARITREEQGHYIWARDK